MPGVYVIHADTVETSASAVISISIRTKVSSDGGFGICVAQRRGVISKSVGSTPLSIV